MIERKRSLLLVLLLAACSSSPAPVADGVLPDAGPVPDGPPAAPDTRRPDGPGPMANVYKNNPVEDKNKTSQVLLKHRTDPEGLLVGKYANVWNCVNEPGKPINLSLGGMSLSGSLCTLAQRAKPGPDGSYLHIVPPLKEPDGGDSFAEVMMYHHMSTLGDHYRTTYGLTRVEKPLRALVNVQVYAFGNWIGIPQAAYFPKQTGDWIKQLTGVDLLNGEEAIVFSYNNLLPQFPTVDLSYDASAIYHEYTHFTIGERLFLPSADQHGVDPTPKGLNEALADYFSADFLDNPKIGSFAFAALARDLTRSFKCPDHLNGEEHNDGEIASGALWAARSVVGREVLNAAVWKAVMGFTMSTTFEQASTAILAELKISAAAKEPAVRQIFTDHGMLGCVRLVPHKDFTIDLMSGQAPSVFGSSYFLGLSYPDGVPASMQYLVNLADTTKEVTIEYQTQGEGFMKGVGGGPVDVWVALRKGSSPITYQYAGGKAAHNAQKVLQGADQAGTRKLVLTGTCISKGDLVLQLTNKSSEAAMVMKLVVTQSPTATQTTPNFDGC